MDKIMDTSPGKFRPRQTHIIYQQLPSQIYGKPVKNPETKLLDIVASDMRPMDFQKAKPDLVYRMFTQLRNPPKKRKQRRGKKYLSRKVRKENNLDRLPKTGWNYESLQEMRNMWMGYMRQCLSCSSVTGYTAPEVTENNYAHFHSILAKVELTGANILVQKSKNPSCVGIEGTIVLETQQTFQVVTPRNELKILLKDASVFVFRFSHIEFTIYGQSLLTRPHERCVKKLKSFIKLDL